PLSLHDALPISDRRPCSASLHGGEDLDPVALRERGGGPLRPRDDGLVDGGGRPGGGRRERAHDVVEDRAGTHRERIAVDRAGDRLVQADCSRRAPAEDGRGWRGRAATGRAPVDSACPRTSPVTGVSSTPLRWCPVASSSPARPVGPRSGALSGEPGRSPARVSVSGSSVIPGTSSCASRSSSYTPPAVTV